MFLKNGALVFDGGGNELMTTANPDIQRFISELRYAKNAQGAEFQAQGGRDV